MPQMIINGCKIAYEEHGTGQNTVLFLHDLFFNGRSFNQQILALRDRYRCVTLDLRGHGESEIDSNAFGLENLAHDVVQFINVQRYGACHIVGAGFGGTVAVKATLERPERTNSLTLIGSALGTSTPIDSNVLKQRRLQIKLFGMRFVTSGLLRRAFSPEYLQAEAHTAQIEHFRRELRSLNRHTLPRAISAYLARPPLLDELYKIRQPALIVAGERDAVVSQDDITQAHNLLDHPTLIRIRDGGHAVHIEKPKSFNPRLLEFLQSA
ncbi:MAG: alpha/beta fold hydrolase [Gammaproteobacteria bacterium]